MKPLKTLTHSMMQYFMDCRQKYQYRYIDEIVPTETPSSLAFGSVIHEALESWFRYGVKEDAIMRIDLTDKLTQPEKIKARAVISKYIDHYETEMFNVDEVEFEFVEKIVHPKYRRRSAFWQLRGKVDGLVRIDGHLFILEHKTTSRVDQAYLDRIMIDSQIATYAYAISKTLKEPVVGAIYDIIVKPMTKFKEGETDEEFEARKAALIAKSKTGKSTAKKQERETDEEFYSRCLEDITDDNFKRVTVMFTQDELKAHMMELWNISKVMHRAPIYKNTGNCNKFSGCPYLPLCLAKGDMTQCQDLFTKCRSHSELSIIDDSDESL